MLLSRVIKDHKKIYGICDETGLRTCEVLPNIWVREDGLYKNTNPKAYKLGCWTKGSTNGATRPTLIICHRKPNLSLSIAQLVSYAFIDGYDPSVEMWCYHKDGNPLNNSVDNLIPCNRKTMFDLSAKSKGRLTGIYRINHKDGVPATNRRKTWYVQFEVDRKKEIIGRFHTWDEAVIARQNYLDRLMYTDNKIVGISRSTKLVGKPWVAQYYANGTVKHIGCYDTQQEAINARDIYMELIK